MGTTTAALQTFDLLVAAVIEFDGNRDKTATTGTLGYVNSVSPTAVAQLSPEIQLLVARAVAEALAAVVPTLTTVVSANAALAPRAPAPQAVAPVTNRMGPHTARQPRESRHLRT